VRDETGSRVEDVEVNVAGRSRNTNDRGLVTATFSDPGEHEVSVLGDETYGTDTVTVRAEGGESSETGPDPETSESAEKSEKSEDLMKLAVIPSTSVIEAGKQIDVTVRSESGNRVEGATVEHGEQKVKTDARGTCTITIETPGEHEVTASHTDNYESATTTITVE